MSFQNNPDGVATVSFDSTDGSDQAVKMLNGRPVRGRNLEAALWDGKTKYKVRPFLHVYYLLVKRKCLTI